MATDPVSLTTFKDKIKSLFGLGEKVKLEIFDRVMLTRKEMKSMSCR